jgi:hypothetical protein
VGDYDSGGATLNQALHWNGTKWSVKTTPSPGGTLSGDDNELFDVVCPAASTCWAIGEDGTNAGTGTTLNQILRWNGTKWSVAATIPQPSGTGDGAFQRLSSIRCTSTSNCLAVGTSAARSGQGVRLNQALQWNGTTWSALSIPSPGGTGDFAFSTLSSLACTSATNCLAAGSYGGFSTVTTAVNQIMHWNGTAWTQDTTIGNPDGTGQGASNELNAITCISPTDCWAAGDYGSLQNGTGQILNQAQHFNGTAWSLATPPNPSQGTNVLSGIRCTGTNNCWAVGQVNVSANQALQWNGTTWLAR